MKLKYIIYILLIVGFGALVAYRIVKTKAGNKGASSKGGMALVRVDGVIAKSVDFSKSLSVSGTIEADQQVQVISQTSGLVQNVYFKEGTGVKKGDLLVTIDDTELQAQLTQALTKQALAAETEKRAAYLVKKGAIPQQEYDIAKAELQSLEAQTQLINAQLAKTKIRAPFDGKIGLSSLAPGEYLVPATVITSLMNVNPVKILFSVPEKYSSQVKLNSTLSFKVLGIDQELTARVYAIEPGIETTTRTLRLKALAANPGDKIIPGSFAQVELHISSVDDAILVPTEAIIPVQDGQKVFVVEHGKAKEVMVQTGTRTAKDIVITEGLKAGDTVVTTGNMALKAGAPVKVNLSN